MKLLMLTAVSTLVLAGCTSQSTLVCPDTVYINKVETPIDTCREEKKSWFTKVTPKPTQGSNDGNEDTNQITTQGGNVTSRVHGSNGGGSNNGDNDQQTRVKGNNGFGNGDQSAPGNSRDNNNAENSNRSQRNHGQGNKN